MWIDIGPFAAAPPSRKGLGRGGGEAARGAGRGAAVASFREGAAGRLGLWQRLKCGFSGIVVAGFLQPVELAEGLVDAAVELVLVAGQENAFGGHVDEQPVGGLGGVEQPRSRPGGRDAPAIRRSARR